MKCMLMMNTTAGGEYQIMSWPKQDIEAHIAFMIDFHKQLAAAMVHGPAKGLELLAPLEKDERLQGRALARWPVGEDARLREPACGAVVASVALARATRRIRCHEKDGRS
ncbi:hypothetical protein ACFPN2_06920 [Steroidobacter flavus]|uniref:YCII-related domain-containing protein n=1 Tax=Steroidobacter flavus TaxID=1842136 RepID=A0ABV8SMI1_9GAMM